MQERYICLDTETTGLDVSQGHRIIEIGCVELIRNVKTDNNLQLYVNPEREIEKSAIDIHGLTNEYLKDKPLFENIAQDFLRFIENATIVAHNAKFDIKFLNYELGMAGLSPIKDSVVIDTVEIAKRKFPGSPVSLDALCKRFNINNSHRDKHGALLDATLLAEIFIALTADGGTNLDFFGTSKSLIKTYTIKKRMDVLASRSFVNSKEELELHSEFVKKITNPIWTIPN